MGFCVRIPKWRTIEMVEAVQVGKLDRYYSLVFAVACSLFVLMQFNLKKRYTSKNIDISTNSHKHSVKGFSWSIGSTVFAHPQLTLRHVS